MITFISKLMEKKAAFAIVCAFVSIITISSCVDNDVDDVNFYSATKRTAAQLLNDNPERYSMFQDILKRANYYSLLSTYGTFTVFAPTNDAVQTYLKEYGYPSVDAIPLVQCDTIARTHIVSKGTYFTTDYSDGTLPQMNMDDRYLVLTSDSDIYNNDALLLYVNKRSKIIAKDDSVTNGVVHTIDRIITPSNDFLPDLIASDTTATIFAEALSLTHMKDSLLKFIDESYKILDDDSVDIGVDIRYGNGDWKAKYPERRYFKYTALVEPDRVFKEKGIENLQDLIKYAKTVYDETFPLDANKYDDDFTNRKNPLNRFISYHLIEGQINYTDLAPSGDIVTNCIRTDIVAPEAFWQSMTDFGMLRFSRPNSVLYVNRKEPLDKPKSYVAGCAGIKVMSPSESGNANQYALNGTYHYLDGILVYNSNVRDKVLNCRMRIDATTLSPDFWNAGAVAHGADILTSFKNGYIKNWKTSPETYIGVRSEFTWMSSYLGNAIAVLGQYDVQIKLPTPPPGLYEVRLGYVVGNERGVVQVYFNNEACGIPIDLRIYQSDPEIGSEADTDDEDLNTANDKALHNRGYMKAMDSYGKPDGGNFRANAVEHMRRILTIQQFQEGKENWLRFRQVLKEGLEWSFDYIELCPKSVYASPEGEDRH